MIIIALSTARGNDRNYINYSKYSAEIIGWLTPMAYSLRIELYRQEYSLDVHVTVFGNQDSFFSRHCEYIDIMLSLPLQLNAYRMR